MYLYQGLVVKQSDKFMSVILKLQQDPEPCCDTIMEKESDTEAEANIWLDDELSRLVNGKGIWDV